LFGISTLESRIGGILTVTVNASAIGKEMILYPTDAHVYFSHCVRVCVSVCVLYRNGYAATSAIPLFAPLASFLLHSTVLFLASQILPIFGSIYKYLVSLSSFSRCQSQSQVQRRSNMSLQYLFSSFSHHIFSFLLPTFS